MRGMRAGIIVMAGMMAMSCAPGRSLKSGEQEMVEREQKERVEMTWSRGADSVTAELRADSMRREDGSVVYAPVIRVTVAQPSEEGREARDEELAEREERSEEKEQRREEMPIWKMTGILIVIGFVVMMMARKR